MGELEGADDLQARFRALQNGTAGRRILGQLGLLAVQYAKELVPRKTGNLGRSIRLGDVDVSGQRVQVLAGGSAARLGASGPQAVGYAAFVEFGTRAHVIRPRRKKALAFPSQRITTERFGSRAKLRFRLSGSLSARSQKRYGNAAFVVTKVVHHPGTRAQPYLLPGAQRALREVGMAKAVIQVWNQAA